MEGVGSNVSLSLYYVSVCVWKVLKLESVCVWEVRESVKVCVWKVLKLESVCVWEVRESVKVCVWNVRREPPTKPRTTMRGVCRWVAPSLSLCRWGVRSLRSCLAPWGFRLRRARISVGSRSAGIVVPRAR